MASTLTGLNLRGTRWYINIVVWPDLRKVYGKRAMNLALGTSDRREATIRGTMMRAEWLAEFDAKRRELKPEPLAIITPELAQELAPRVRARVLRQDDTLRDDASILAPFTDAVKAAEYRRCSALSIGTLPSRCPLWQRRSLLRGLARRCRNRKDNHDQSRRIAETRSHGSLGTL